MEVFIYLNTSHVLIYLYVTNNNKGGWVKFKYISCSYLSFMETAVRAWFRDLNTSHVLIYLITELKLPLWSANLNTSHVLIYQLMQTMRTRIR